MLGKERRAKHKKAIYTLNLQSTINAISLFVVEKARGGLSQWVAGIILGEGNCLRSLARGTTVHSPASSKCVWGRVGSCNC